MVLGSFGILEDLEHDGQEVPTVVMEVPARASYQGQSCGEEIGGTDMAQVGDHCSAPLKVLTQDEYFCSMSLVFQVMAGMAAWVAGHI